MCGIVGFNWEDRKLIDAMNATIVHRGPDASGVACDAGVSLGHRRLSIIDLTDAGAQPMSYEQYTVVYNGEIYNFQEIKEELLQLGHTFVTESDTEVVLHSYAEWGQQCLEKFNGMWALCIYDKKKNQLFLSRDRFGIKPLYYYWDGARFVFASELKAIRAHDIDFQLNNVAVNYFFYQRYIGGKNSIYKNVYKLQPGHFVLLSLGDCQLESGQYYSLEDEIARARELSIKQRVELIKQNVSDAIKARLIADVPVGSFLSGGLDSSFISAVLKKEKKDLKTFSIGFKEKSYNELEFSKIVAEHIGTSHHYEYQDIDEEVIEYVLQHMDEPFGDSSVIPTYLLSKITRKWVTVSLSGDAGDEVFGGYDTYRSYKLAKWVPGFCVPLIKLFAKMLPVSNKKVTLSFKIKRFARDFSRNVLKRHVDWMATYNDENRRSLLGEHFVASEAFFDFGKGKGLLPIQLIDIKNYLAEDINKKVDFASMLVSLEARVPFLDCRVVPLVLSLPERYKIRFLKQKWLLKKFSYEYIPSRIINRRKRGFTVPITTWIKESALIGQYLTEKSYFEHGCFGVEYVRSLFDAHLANAADNSRQLWLVFVFNYWWANVHNGQGK